MHHLIFLPKNPGSNSTLFINGTIHTRTILLKEYKGIFWHPSFILCIGILCILVCSLMYFLNNKGKHVKLQPPNSLHKTTKICLLIASFAISLIILPITFTTVTIFGSYRLIIRFILRIKYHRAFGGLLQGTDTIWALEDISKSAINILMVIETKSKNPEYIFQTVRNTLYEKFFQDPKSFPKLSSARHSFGGYQFLLEGQFSINDCVQMVDFNPNVRVLNKKDIEEYVSIHSNLDMPHRNTALWEVKISSKSVDWNQTNAVYFPVLFRIHHSLVDGVSLVKLLIGCLAENLAASTKRFESMKTSTEVFQEIPTNKLCINLKVQVVQFLETLWAFVKSCFDTFYLLTIAPATMMLELVFRKPDVNFLHGPQLSGEKICVFAVEEERKLIDVVKAIKNKTSTRFSDVILTGISASFTQFYEQQRNVPISVTAVIPALLKIEDLANMSTGTYVTQNEVLHNNFSVGMLNLPININKDLEKCDNFTLEDRLNEVKIRTKLLRKSREYQINYWLLSVVSAVLPEPILRPLLNSTHSTMVVSNLPGCGKVWAFNKNIIEDIVFWIPHRGTTGIGISILTYDDRFQLGMIIDKALLPSKEQAQIIIDNVFENIYSLYNELSNV